MLGKSFKPTSGSQACTPVTVCQSNQFIAVPATLTSDNVCRNESLCTATEFQFAAMTPTTDRVCHNCSVCPT